MNILLVNLSTDTLTNRSLTDPLPGGRLLIVELITELVDPPGSTFDVPEAGLDHIWDKA